MNDRPTAGELVDAVRLFLEKELLPGLSDARLRFQTLVAANVLAIAGREMAGEEAMLREEWRLLAPLVREGAPEPAGMTELRRMIQDMDERLCALIRKGTFDDAARWRDLAPMLRQSVLRKLEVANPRFVTKRSNTGAP
jgi:hypothetical protein